MWGFDKPLTWIIILVIVLLIFGAGKLPDIGRSLGKSIKEFKEETQIGMNGGDKKVDAPVATSTNLPPTSTASLPTEPTVRRRIIKHPDGREEIIEETIIQK
jgi:sec-independent protein translocase protein TatA